MTTTTAALQALIEACQAIWPRVYSHAPDDTEAFMKAIERARAALSAPPAAQDAPAEFRQLLGEALTTKLAEMCEDGAPDWFDAAHIDEVLDVLMPHIHLAPTSQPTTPAAHPVAGQADDASTEHGPWLPSTLHDGETYCQRCHCRSVFQREKKCEPHVAAPTAPQAPVQEVRGVVRALTEDERAAVEFYRLNPTAALFDLDQRVNRKQAPALVPLTEHHKLDNDQQVFFYEQDFYILSNFSSFALRWKGLDFPTSEHAYHWEKYNMRGEQQAECRNRIHGARSAHDAFKVASELKPFRRADWDDVKVGIMRDILRTKANQHEYVRRKLLATGDRELVEDSWRDDYWGWGPNRDGQNMLGKLWMEVRAEFQAGITPTTKEQQ